MESSPFSAICCICGEDIHHKGYSAAPVMDGYCCEKCLKETVIPAKRDTQKQKYMDGYKFISTFWNDFAIADHFGPDAVRDTYYRAFNEWKGDYKMLTELVLVLNWRIWFWWEKCAKEEAKLYDELWQNTADYAESHLKGKEYEYYFDMTD